MLSDGWFYLWTFGIIIEHDLYPGILYYLDNFYIFV